jgi:hypothetical protein
LIRTLLIAASAFAMLSAPALAAPCKDAKGKFIKCPPAVTKPVPKRCKSANGKFAKCGTPGAKPV